MRQRAVARRMPEGDLCDRQRTAEKLQVACRLAGHHAFCMIPVFQIIYKYLICMDIFNVLDLAQHLQYPS